MKRAGVVVAVALGLSAAPALADEDDAIRAAFEGRVVAPRIALPASKSGVNVYPERVPPLNLGEVEQDMYRNGVGVAPGQRVVVTRIKAKGKHIEFQLGQGGESQIPTFQTPYVPQSRTEKRLRDELKDADDPEVKKRLKERIRDHEDRRRREQRQLESLARIEYEAEVSRYTPEEWALMAGARFNVRYDHDVPAEALTPEGLMATLDEWLDFAPPPEPDPEGAGVEDAGLHKGMTADELAAAYGLPDRCDDSEAGGLSVRTCVFELDDGYLEAQLVDDVLVKFTLSSEAPE
jgi:hypothetical protein